ncbi:hypothetical protein E1212_01975 [Jiangella ureilytica]|uniref:Activator of Hsp90 ATPase homologue 1/2-like C-terminal domain-containing protein n=1 Tax=Jiangella ureilytica TaxID=2530374 RepID=A0A4R4RXP5_9ACTN|nr:SRPBCC domain-containing protein [Jiangella ureilytica]TDC54546.1 hypothetical protein E1212_01975 [Jiangella ureilytica]
MNHVPPLRREVLVQAAPAVAFDVFTSRIGRWWPLAEHGVYHERAATVVFDGGVLVERSTTGEESVWGTVTHWEPPATVAFTWHPGRPADAAGLVEVSFGAVDGGTLVTLRHSGWEAYADPAAARADYDHGWPTVLGRYSDEVARAGDAATWALLLHRPAPDAGIAGPIVDDPRFREHVAFLGRMRAAGHLVAAGPLGDADGEGVTVLRLPGSGRDAEIVRLASEDDRSVRDGLFTVAVRPWRVTLTGPNDG